MNTERMRGGKKTNTCLKMFFLRPFTANVVLWVFQSALLRKDRLIYNWVSFTEYARIACIPALKMKNTNQRHIP